MKKIVCVTLTTIMILLLLTGCGSKKNDSGSVGSSTSAEALLQDIWGAFNEKDQFAVSGGDEKNAAQGPARFEINADNAETFQYLLHVTDEMYAQLENDAATMQHMMNTNTFSAAVVKLKSGIDTKSFADSYQQELNGQQWMCGFPDKMLVLSLGDYLVIGYGKMDNMDNLQKACAKVDSNCSIVIEAPLA